MKECHQNTKTQSFEKWFEYKTSFFDFLEP